ncbi:sensor histidine kinase [Geminicoccus roseus]|uniref:sensor histidine kinase n=1 Tax=Geminicoccus roseus TaxID=404900 RepID=UPI000410A42A|nr:sensor histidine kinase [Geminicoccus roseus]
MDPIARLFQDPILLFDRHGALLEMNRPARTLLGIVLAPGNESRFDQIEGLRALLTLASGAGEPVVGGLRLQTASGEDLRVRARAVVTLRSGERREFAVQLLNKAKDEFSILSQRVVDLNREIVARRGTQARLEDTLAHNQVLYRELQHRVKNHLQMMLGMFSVARREAEDPGQRAVIRNLELKMRAIGEAQHLMYLSDSSTSVAADALLKALGEFFQALAGEEAQVTVAAQPIQIPNDMAFPLALIVNELLSNAVKYGLTDGRGRIEVVLRQIGPDLELEVQDSGTGFVPPPPGRRSSGLGLVRGLCRQIGAQLIISSGAGASVLVRIALPA